MKQNVLQRRVSKLLNESCRVNMTVLLSFEEKTDDARACA